ncbi:hypothetical protein [Nocardioides terrigena]|uniref:hypothetical protein n=1 Tax=Nocardioides terrigena TaxID=424797 RepID=UPI00131EF225|nr:hypothetical protein [Nocardioides terrigena]
MDRRALWQWAVAINAVAMATTLAIAILFGVFATTNGQPRGPGTSQSPSPGTEPDNPEPDNPEPDNPEPDNPEPDNPEPDNPEPDNPEPDNPEPDNPEPDNPEPAEGCPDGALLPCTGN